MNTDAIIAALLAAGFAAVLGVRAWANNRRLRKRGVR